MITSLACELHHGGTLMRRGVNDSIEMNISAFLMHEEASINSHNNSNHVLSKSHL